MSEGHQCVQDSRAELKLMTGAIKSKLNDDCCTAFLVAPTAEVKKAALGTRIRKRKRGHMNHSNSFFLNFHYIRQHIDVASNGASNVNQSSTFFQLLLPSAPRRHRHRLQLTRRFIIIPVLTTN